MFMFFKKLEGSASQKDIVNTDKCKVTCSSSGVPLLMWEMGLRETWGFVGPSGLKHLQKLKQSSADVNQHLKMPGAIWC